MSPLDPFATHFLWACVTCALVALVLSEGGELLRQWRADRALDPRLMALQAELDALRATQVEHTIDLQRTRERVGKLEFAEGLAPQARRR